MRTSISFAAFWLLGLLALVLPAHAETYLPLAQGCRWTYAGDAGDQEIVECIGEVEIWGESVSVLLYSGQPDDGLQNFWSGNAEGDVFLWGFLWPGRFQGLLYDPPILMVDAPLTVGDSWTCTFDVYTLPDTLYMDTWQLERVVLAEGKETVPAGTYFAHVLAFPRGSGWASTALGQTRSLTGHRIEPGDELLSAEYWVEGVGQIRWASNQIWRLTEFSAPTATNAGSWGGIKALY